MRTISAKYKSLCVTCKDVILPGTEIIYDETVKKTYHVECRPAEQAELPTGEAEALADRLGFE